MRLLSFGLLFLVTGAVAAWAVSVFALQLPWETSLLVIEISAILSCLAGLAVVQSRRKNEHLKKRDDGGHE